jgi:hypothetical protein
VRLSSAAAPSVANGASAEDAATAQTCSARHPGEPLVIVAERAEVRHPERHQEPA